MRAGNHQLAAAAQHHLTGEHHLAAGLDGDVAIHIQPLAKGHVQGIADHQTFQAGQFQNLETQGPGVLIGRRARHQVAKLRACRRQGVAHFVATAHRHQRQGAHTAAFDCDVGRGAAATAAGEHHALVGEAAIFIGHGQAGVTAKVAALLHQLNARGGATDAVANPAIYRDAALVG